VSGGPHPRERADPRRRACLLIARGKHHLVRSNRCTGRQTLRSIPLLSGGRACLLSARYRPARPLVSNQCKRHPSEDAYESIANGQLIGVRVWIVDADAILLGACHHPHILRQWAFGPVRLTASSPNFALYPPLLHLPTTAPRESSPGCTSRSSSDAATIDATLGTGLSAIGTPSPGRLVKRIRASDLNLRARVGLEIEMGRPREFAG
jgi:hypothetical protein